MYDDKLRETIIDDLEGKTISIANTAIVLASQGYLINKSKYIRLDWSSIMIHALENINLMTKDQQRKVENLYSKLITI